VRVILAQIDRLKGADRRRLGAALEARRLGGYVTIPRRVLNFVLSISGTALREMMPELIVTLTEVGNDLEHRERGIRAGAAKRTKSDLAQAIIELRSGEHPDFPGRRRLKEIPGLLAQINPAWRRVTLGAVKMHLARRGKGGTKK
jgi:hypothetical protein